MKKEFLRVKAVATGKQNEQGREIFKALGSSISVDRDGDLLLPQGCDYKNYLKNPVILKAHDYSDESYGKTLSIEIKEDGVYFEFVFSDDETGLRLEKKYKDGIQSAFSVSFLIKNLMEVPQDAQKVTVNANGEAIEIDLTKFEKRPSWIISEWELLELSVVAIPANQDAVLLSIEKMAKDYINEKHAKSSDVVRKLAEERINRMLEDISKKVLEIEKESEVKTAVPVHNTPIDNESEWNKNDAIVTIAKWASSNGSGDKETIDFKKYALGFAWFNEEATENLTSYKLPHHIVDESGKLIAVWQGVVSAMASLLGARGGVNIPDNERKAVYDHLAQHYIDNGKEPPELKSYTEEELEKIFSEEQEKQTPKEKEPETETEKSNDNIQIEEKIKNLAKDIAELKELNTSINIKLSLIYDSVNTKTVSGNDKKENSDIMNELEKLKKTIKSFV